MTTLLLEPHADDIALFAAYAACAAADSGPATIVTVLHRGALGAREARQAAIELGCGWVGLSIPEHAPDWERIDFELRAMDRLNQPGAVYAPLPNEAGHPHHNLVGDIAGLVFGGRCRYYTTYLPGRGRECSAHAVTPDPDWIVRKLRALACFESQIHREDTRAWFTGGLDEWIASAAVRSAA